MQDATDSGQWVAFGATQIVEGDRQRLGSAASATTLLRDVQRLQALFDVLTDQDPDDRDPAH